MGMALRWWIVNCDPSKFRPFEPSREIQNSYWVVGQSSKRALPSALVATSEVEPSEAQEPVLNVNLDPRGIDRRSCPFECNELNGTGS